MGVASLMLWWVTVQGTGALELPLHWQAGDEPRGWPLPFALELCELHSRPGLRTRVEGTGGRELPARVEVLASWPGSRPRLVRVVPGAWPAQDQALRVALSRHPPPATGLRLTQEGTDLELRAGPGRDVLTLHGGILGFGDERSAVAFDLGRMLLDVDGVSLTRLRITRWTRQGPDAAGAEWNLQLAPDQGAGSPCEVLLKVQVTQDAGFLELQLSVRALETMVLHRWSLPGRLTGAAPALVGEDRQRPEAGAVAEWATPAPQGATLGPDPELCTGGGGARLTCRWDEAAWGPAARARLQADGRWRLDLVAEDFLLQRGQVLRQRLRVGRGRALPVRAPVLGARPATLVELPGIGGWLERWRDFLLAWSRRRVPAGDRGCYPMPDGSFANGEYDLGGSLLAMAGWTGQAAWREPGLLLVHHTRDRDVAVDPPPPWPEGLRAMHGFEHGSDRVEAGHLWADGLVQEVLQSGAPESLQAARDLARALLRCLDEPELFAGPERRLAWPLRVATDVARLHPEDGRRLAVALVERLCRQQSAAGFLVGDRRRQGGGEVVWVNTWVSLGITVESLLRAEASWSLEEAGEAARRLGGWLLTEGIRDGRLCEVLRLDPDTSAVLSRQGACRAGAAALAAVGIVRLADSGVASAPGMEVAVDLWERALADLAQPREHDLVEFAKALQALRSLLETPSAALLIPGWECRPRRCSCRAGP